MKSQLCRMKRDSLADAIRKMPLHTCEVSVPSRRMMIPGRIPPMAGFIMSNQIESQSEIWTTNCFCVSVLTELNSCLGLQCSKTQKETMLDFDPFRTAN